MGRKKKVQSDDEEQSKRLIEAARHLYDKNSEDKFDDAVMRILPEKPYNQALK